MSSKSKASGCFLEDLEQQQQQEVMDTDVQPPKDLSAAEVSAVGAAIGMPTKQKSDHSSSLDLDGALPGRPLASTTDSHDDAMDMSAVSTLSLGDFCKICHCGSETNASLIAPCFCSGSLKYVHQECLQRWIKSSDIKRCELCKYPFAMQAKVKPFRQWEKLDMSSLERRKLLCSVSFHVIAITCVVWSLYVLIDRTADEIRHGELQWPFWTKLVVVAIGFTGGLVFMYIQCKVYVHLCRKWKAYNRIIVVQDAPEGIHKPSTDTSAGAAEASQQSPAGESSRRSSSAPGSAQDRPNNNAAAAAAAAASEKTNAETQTALRGVSMLEDECHAHSSRRGEAGAAIFFTECECGGKNRWQKETAPPTSTNLRRSKSTPHSASTPNVSSGGGAKSCKASHRGRDRDREARRTRNASNRRRLSLSPSRRALDAPDLPGSPEQREEGEESTAKAPANRKGGRGGKKSGARTSQSSSTKTQNHT